MGIEIRTNTPIGKNLTLEQLQQDYDYIFLASGAHGSLKSGISGEDSKVMNELVLELLRRVALVRN